MSPMQRRATNNNNSSARNNTMLNKSPRGGPSRQDIMRILITIFLSVTLTLIAVYTFDYGHANYIVTRLDPRMTNQTLITSATTTTKADSETQPVSASSTTKPLHMYTRAKRRVAKCATDSNNPAKSFLMIFMSRSGSTAISQTMAIHPSISQSFEFLGTDYSKGSAFALNKTRTLFRTAIAKGKIPGFKLRAMHVTADPGGWAALAREFDTRIIWQYRKNVFKTGLGIYARMVFNDYTATGGIKTEDYKSEEDRCNMGVGCSFAINDWPKFHMILTGRVRQDLEMVRAVKILDDGRECSFELPYEDYLYYKEDTLKDLFKFLGLKPNKFDTFRVKATKDSMCDVIENFDELCDHFYGCPIWQPFLDDFENDCRCTKFGYGSAKYCSMFSPNELELAVAGNYP